MCQTVGLWHISPRPSLAVLARKLLPNLKPIPLALVIRHGGDLFQIWERVGSDVRLVLNFYERAERASSDYNFQAIHTPYIALHIFPVIAWLWQRFRTTRCTVLCGNITIYVKLLVNCKLLSVRNSINTCGSWGCCDFFNVPMCQAVGLWHTFTRPSLAALARKL